MPHIPTVVCQSHGLDQQEMSGNYFLEENHIGLVQASQRPVKTILIHQVLTLTIYKNSGKVHHRKSI